MASFYPPLISLFFLCGHETTEQTSRMRFTLDFMLCRYFNFSPFLVFVLFRFKSRQPVKHESLPKLFLFSLFPFSCQSFPSDEDWLFLDVAIGNYQSVHVSSQRSLPTVAVHYETGHQNCVFSFVFVVFRPLLFLTTSSKKDHPNLTAAQLPQHSRDMIISFFIMIAVVLAAELLLLADRYCLFTVVYANNEKPIHRHTNVDDVCVGVEDARISTQQRQ